MCISYDALIIFPYENRWAIYRDFSGLFTRPERTKIGELGDVMNYLYSTASEGRSWVIDDLKLVYRGVPCGSAVRIWTGHAKFMRWYSHWCIWVGLDSQGEPMLIHHYPGKNSRDDCSDPRIEPFSLILEKFKWRCVQIYLCKLDAPNNLCRAAALHRAFTTDIGQYRLLDNNCELYVNSCFEVAYGFSQQSWFMCYDMTHFALKLVIASALLSTFVLGPSLPIIEIMLLASLMYVVMKLRHSWLVNISITVWAFLKRMRLIKKYKSGILVTLPPAATKLANCLNKGEDFEASEVARIEKELLQIFYDLCLCQGREKNKVIFQFSEKDYITKKTLLDGYLRLRLAYVRRIVSAGVSPCNIGALDAGVFDQLGKLFADLKASVMGLYYEDEGEEYYEIFTEIISFLAVTFLYLFFPANRDKAWWTEENLLCVKNMLKDMGSMITVKVHPVQADISYKNNVFLCLNSYWHIIITYSCGHEPVTVDGLRAAGDVLADVRRLMSQRGIDYTSRPSEYNVDRVLLNLWLHLTLVLKQLMAHYQAIHA